MIGQVIGRYRIVARIRRGAVGDVWRAEDTLLRRAVALEVLSGPAASDAATRAKFLDAARVASHLTHPNIAATYDCGEEETRAFVARELVEGMPLRVWRRRRRTPVEIDAVMSQVEHAVGALRASRLAVVGSLLDTVLVDGHGVAKLACDVVQSAAQEDDFADLDSLRHALGEGARRARRRRVGAWAVVALAVLATGTVTLRMHLQSRGEVTRIDSIAVLPLRNMSDNPEASEYLASAVGEALVDKLIKLPGLRVSPWATSSRYDPTTMSIDAIAADLGVQAVVQGTFRLLEDRILVDLSLVDGKRATQRWQQHFESPGSGFLEVQRHIVVEVASALDRARAVGPVAPVSHSPAAYEAYLRGRLAFLSREPAARDYFEQAIALDSLLAEAHVGLGAVWTSAYFSDRSNPSDLEAAERAFNAALRIQPGMIAAYRGLMHVAFNRGRDEECLRLGREIQRTTRTDVEALLGRAYAYHLGALFEKAIVLYDSILAMDPGNMEALEFLCLSHEITRNPHAAIRAGEEAIRRKGTDHLGFMARAHMQLGNSHIADSLLTLIGEDWAIIPVLARMAKTDPDQAMRGFEEMLTRAENLNDRRSSLELLARLGRRNECLEAEQHTLDRFADDPYTLLQLGSARAILGDTTEAVAFFRAALRHGNRYQFLCLNDYGFEREYLQPIAGYRALQRECLETLQRLAAEY